MPERFFLLLLLLFTSQHLLFYSLKYSSSLSFHHRMVKQIAFCSGIMHVQNDFLIFLNYCSKIFKNKIIFHIFNNKCYMFF